MIILNKKFQNGSGFSINNFSEDEHRQLAMAVINAKERDIDVIEFAGYSFKTGIHHKRRFQAEQERKAKKNGPLRAAFRKFRQAFKDALSPR